MDGGAAQRIDSDPHAGRADQLHVHDISQVRDVGRDVVVFLNAGGLSRLCIGKPHHLFQSADEKLVGRALYPARHLDVRGPAVGRVVFESAILRRIVRGADDNPVRQTRCPAPIVGEDGVRDDRRRRIAPKGVDPRLNAVCGQHLDRGGECGLRQGVGVHAQEQRTIDAGMATIETNRLCDRRDVHLIERGLERRSPMARRTEGDSLCRNGRIRLQGEIGRH